MKELKKKKTALNLEKEKNHNIGKNYFQRFFFFFC